MNLPETKVIRSSETIALCAVTHPDGNEWVCWNTSSGSSNTWREDLLYLQLDITKSSVRATNTVTTSLSQTPRDLSKNRKNKKTSSIITFVKAREIISQPALLLHSPRKVLQAEAISLPGDAGEEKGDQETRAMFPCGVNQQFRLVEAESFPSYGAAEPRLCKPLRWTAGR